MQAKCRVFSVDMYEQSLKVGIPRFKQISRAQGQTKIFIRQDHLLTFKPSVVPYPWMKEGKEGEQVVISEISTDVLITTFTLYSL